MGLSEDSFSSQRITRVISELLSRDPSHGLGRERIWKRVMGRGKGGRGGKGEERRKERRRGEEGKRREQEKETR